MHELSLAQGLLDIVGQEAAKHGVAAIAKVVVKIGEFTHVVPKSLQFSFDLIKKDTVAENAELVLVPVPLTAFCLGCETELTLKEPKFICPHCGSEDVMITSGQELMLDYLEAADE